MERMALIPHGAARLSRGLALACLSFALSVLPAVSFGSALPGPGRPQAVAVICQPGPGVVANSIDEAVKSRKATMQLIGDGTTTSHVQLKLTNVSDTPLYVHVDRGQVFLPADILHQLMMTIKDYCQVIPPGQTVIAVIETVCISPKTVKPPEPESVYEPGQDPDPDHQRTVLSLVSTAETLEGQNRFDEVPVAPSRRPHTIAQLAIWAHEGEVTQKPEDQVTEQTIADDFLRSAHISRESLTPAQEKAFTQGVKFIFLAVDVTAKTSRSKIATASGAPEGTYISNEPPDGGTAPAKKPDGTGEDKPKKPEPEKVVLPAPKETKLPDGTRVIPYPEGLTVIVYPDGSFTRRYPDGHEVTEQNDGTVIVKETWGLIKTMKKDGTYIFTYPDGKQVVMTPQTTTKPDGTTVTEFPSGNRRIVSPDGTVREEDSSGTIATTTKPDGTVIKELGDGTKVTLHTNGFTTVRRADGSKVIKGPFGTKIEPAPPKSEAGDKVF